jgi:hypothetical protein
MAAMTQNGTKTNPFFEYKMKKAEGKMRSFRVKTVDQSSTLNKKLQGTEVSKNCIVGSWDNFSKEGQRYPEVREAELTLEGRDADYD